MRRERRPDEATRARFIRIYLASFPPSSRVSTRKIMACVAAGKRRLYAARAEGALVGFALTAPLPGTGAHYLEYLAVAPRSRSRGVGGAILSALRRRLGRARAATGIIFEVKPDNHPDAAENALRRRRVEFYVRNGACIIKCAPRYRAPDMATGGSARFLLMWLPLRNGAEAPCGDALKGLIRGIYLHAYERGADDTLLRSVLRGVLRRVPQGSR